MTCELCGGTENVFLDNYITCTSCGNQMTYQPKYVHGYSRPFQHRRQQYYSRIKRFAQKLRDIKSDIIGYNTEDILSTYSLIEFAWNMCSNRTRKYFFSQKVVLFFILELLGIQLVVPVLKNKDRTDHQLGRMRELVDSSKFL